MYRLYVYLKNGTTFGGEPQVRVNRMSEIFLLFMLSIFSVGCEDFEFKDELKEEKFVQEYSEDTTDYVFQATLDPGLKNRRGSGNKVSRKLKNGDYKAQYPFTVGNSVGEVTLFLPKSQYLGEFVQASFAYNRKNDRFEVSASIYDRPNSYQVTIEHIQNLFMSGAKQVEGKVSLCESDRGEGCRSLVIEFRQLPQLKTKFLHDVSDQKFNTFRKVDIKGKAYFLFGVLEVSNKDKDTHLIDMFSHGKSARYYMDVEGVEASASADGCWTIFSNTSTSFEVGTGPLIPLSNNYLDHLSGSMDHRENTKFVVPANATLFVGVYGASAIPNKSLSAQSLIPENVYEMVPNGCGPKVCHPYKKESTQEIYLTKKTTGATKGQLGVRVRASYFVQFENEEFSEMKTELSFDFNEDKGILSSYENEPPTKTISKFPGRQTIPNHDCKGTSLGEGVY